MSHLNAKTRVEFTHTEKYLTAGLLIGTMTGFGAGVVYGAIRDYQLAISVKGQWELDSVSLFGLVLFGFVCAFMGMMLGAAIGISVRKLIGCLNKW